MNENLARGRDRFIEGIGRLATTVGVSRVIGQLYAMLFLSNKPLCLNDMVERLKISKGNASLNIRELEKLGLVKRVWVRGDRRDFYEAELDFEKMIRSGIIGAVKRRMEVVVDTVTETENLIEKARTNLDPEGGKTAELYLKRLGSVREIYKFTEGLLRNIFPEAPP
ncbi:hypothetical protein ES703_34783 [subsurface metagenome]